MGATGRNTLFAVFIASFTLTVTGKVLDFPVTLFFVTTLITGLSFFYYYPYSYLARRESRKIGFTCIELLPVNPLWAKLVLKLAGKKLNGKITKAFEVHLKVPPGIGLTEYLKEVGYDLKLARKTLPGSLFFWETVAPIPSDVRKLLREKEAEGTALWEEKRWPLPRFAFMERDLKRGRVRRGAILLQKGEM